MSMCIINQTGGVKNNANAKNNIHDSTSIWTLYKQQFYDWVHILQKSIPLLTSKNWQKKINPAYFTESAKDTKRKNNQAIWTNIKWD